MARQQRLTVRLHAGELGLLVRWHSRRLKLHLVLLGHDALGCADGLIPDPAPAAALDHDDRLLTYLLDWPSVAEDRLREPTW